MTGSGARPGGAAGAWSVAQRIAALARVSLPEAASGYAASGVAVFPCVPGQKRPLTAHGLRDASTDAELVESWWRRWPAANIGIPTGQVSGLDVLDVDVRLAGSGFEAFDRLQALGLADGWAVLVRTPSGGAHAYYPAVPGRPQRCWQSANAHLDFRGDGGYVIAPPSLAPGPGGDLRRYVVLAVADAVAKPVEADRIRTLLLPRTVQQSGPARQQRGASVDVAALAAWVAARAEGERNRGLFWAACRLAERGAGQAEIEAALGAAAANAGLATGEIVATIRSATRTATQIATPTDGPPAAAAVRRPATTTDLDDTSDPYPDVHVPTR